MNEKKSRRPISKLKIRCGRSPTLSCRTEFTEPDSRGRSCKRRTNNVSIFGVQLAGLKKRAKNGMKRRRPSQAANNNNNNNGKGDVSATSFGVEYSNWRPSVGWASC